jgi:hypothetical protein
MAAPERFMARLFAALLFVVLAAWPASAQEPPIAELLRRVPEEMPLCLLLNDLRGQSERLRQQAWFEKAKDNPLVQAFLDSREFRDLRSFEAEVRKHIGVDVQTLRDDIFGDAVVFAFQPGSPGREKGLLLIKTHKPELLAQIVDKVNSLQSTLGELTVLEPKKFHEQTYYRRVHQQNTHYYFQQGPLFAITSDEAILQAVLSRSSETTSRPFEQMRAAGVDRALAAVWLNPRAFDAQLEQTANSKLGAEGVVLEHVLKFWKGLDGILLSLDTRQALEARLTLLARPGNDARHWLTSTETPSDLWSRFPSDALVATAGRIDFTRALEQVLALSPAKDRKAFQDVFEKNLRAATGHSFGQTIVPNVGPDAGFCILAPEDSRGIPQGLFALRVKSEPTEAPVDRSLYQSAQLLAGLAVFEYNRKHTDPIRILTAQQKGVEVKYLAQDKLFPPGVQPALALKDGYLLLASSPEAIARFGAVVNAAPTSDGEVPLVKLSLPQIARLVRQRRELLIDHMVEKSHESPAMAARIVEGLAAGLDLFESLQFSQRTADGQASWIVRLTPRKN